MQKHRSKKRPGGIIHAIICTNICCHFNRYGLHFLSARTSICAICRQRNPISHPVSRKNTSTCCYGASRSLLLQKYNCFFPCRISSPVSLRCSSCHAALVERKYPAEHFRRHHLLYVFGPSRFLCIINSSIAFLQPLFHRLCKKKTACCQITPQSFSSFNALLQIDSSAHIQSIPTQFQ